MKNFDEFEEVLYSHSTNRIIPGIERIERLLSRLGNPQNSFKSVHIVGTNGKGSTGAFISSVLRASGYKTAFYSSPHLESPGERLVIDGEALSADDWIAASDEVIKKILPGEELPSYFELVTACAFLLAREHHIDAGVIEAGLGGKFDATNVMSNTACSVVASVSIDHTEYLGPTLESIASEKFAVVKKDTPACFSGLDASLVPMFKDFCSERGARPFVLTEDARLDNVKISPAGNSFDFHSRGLELTSVATKLIGDYQISNAALSLLAVSTMRGSFPNITEASIRSGMSNATWPGRLEVISREPLIILDGGHNYDGVSKLCASLRSLWPDTKLGVVYAAMRDKNYSGCLELLSGELNPTFYATTVPGMARALTPEELRDAAKNFEWRNSPEAFSDPREAVRKALRDDNQAVIVCGSLYLIGWIKRNS